MAEHHREEIKNAISLREIQDTYFSFIEQSFGQFYKIMKEKGMPPHDAGWLVMGTLGIAAAATGEAVWGLAAIAADQLLDAPKLKDIPKSIKTLAMESNNLRLSPVGMLFKISKGKA